MRRIWLAGVALAGVVLASLAAVVLLGRSSSGKHLDAAFPTGPSAPVSTAHRPDPSAASEAWQGFLYGRVTSVKGATYQGRLRFGGGEEAFWSDYFNGSKAANPWAEHVPAERLKERVPFEVFGVTLGHRERKIELGRPFFVRFGELERIEARGGELRVTLKSGRVVELDRYGADDLADGVRVWDETQGMVDLDEWSIATIELLPTPPLADAAARLYGTVTTRQGDFAGYLQWNRDYGLGSDWLAGRTADGELDIPFGTIRTIARAPTGCRLSLLDGRELDLEGRREPACASRGLFVDDPRYGRVLIDWAAFERVELGPAPDSGPAFGDFRPGRPLEGTVLTRDGRRLQGRLVYDLDESETIDTFDSPAQDLSFSLPFGHIAAISLPRGAGGRASVVLRSGEQLLLEYQGDLGPANAGLLVFAEGKPAEHVPWSEVELIELAALALSPPL